MASQDPYTRASDQPRPRVASDASVAAALARFGVDASPRRRRARLLAPLGAVASLLLVVLSLVTGLQIAERTGHTEAAPTNANHCVDSVGMGIGQHGCAVINLVSPTNGTTGLSTTPTLQVSMPAYDSFEGYSAKFDVCSDSACSSIIRTNSTAYMGTPASPTWVVSPALSAGTYWWRATRAGTYTGNGYLYPTATWQFTVGAGNTAPNAPSSLAQYRSDGTTAIASSAWTNQSTVVLKFNVSDANASQTLTPWVEVRTTNSFTGTCGTAGAGMYSGANVAAATGGTNYLATVTVAGLSNSNTYYWRACSVDQSGAIGAWTARGAAPDFRLDVTAPSNPASANIYDQSSSFSADRDWSSSSTALSASFDVGSDTPAGIASYDVCFSSVNSGCTNIAGTTTITGNTTRIASATATAMTNGTVYYTCVRSNDAAGNQSGWTCSDGFRIDTTVPAPASPVNDGTGADASILVGTAVDANWAAVTDTAPGVTAGYDWCLNDQADCSTSVIASGNAVTTSVNTSASSLVHGSVYRFCVRTVDSAGNASAYTCSNSFTYRELQVTSTSPATVAQGRVGVVVQVNGAGFVSGATVGIAGGGISITNTAFVSASRIDVTLTVAGAAVLTARDVTVTNPSTVAYTATGALTVVAPSITLGLSTLDVDDTVRDAAAPYAIGFGAVIPGTSRSIGPSGSGQVIPGEALRVTRTTDTDTILQGNSTTFSNGSTTMPASTIAWRLNGSGGAWTPFALTDTTIVGAASPGSSTDLVDLQVTIPAGQAAGTYTGTLTLSLVAVP